MKTPAFLQGLKNSSAAAEIHIVKQQVQARTNNIFPLQYACFALKDVKYDRFFRFFYKKRIF